MYLSHLSLHKMLRAPLETKGGRGMPYGFCPVLFFFFFSLHFRSQELLSRGLPSLDFLNHPLLYFCFLLCLLQTQNEESLEGGQGRVQGDC